MYYISPILWNVYTIYENTCLHYAIILSEKYK